MTSLGEYNVLSCPALFAVLAESPDPVQFEQSEIVQRGTYRNQDANSWQWLEPCPLSRFDDPHTVKKWSRFPMDRGVPKLVIFSLLTLYPSYNIQSPHSAQCSTAFRTINLDIWFSRWEQECFPWLHRRSHGGGIGRILRFEWLAHAHSSSSPHGTW